MKRRVVFQLQMQKAENKMKIFPLGCERVPGDTVNIHFKEGIFSVSYMGTLVSLTSGNGSGKTLVACRVASRDSASILVFLSASGASF